MSSDKLYGYTGKLLRLDLSAARFSDLTFDKATLRKYPGGTALGARILYDEAPPGVEWDDPRNRLILATGPLTGTRIGGSGGYSLVTMGPMTNGAAATQANGFFGAYLRMCGYDGIVVQGASNRWTYVYIHDDQVEFREASHLLGQDTWETEDSIKKEIGGSVRQLSVFCIGPAGEHQVKFAGVFNDRGHTATHNGPGAVMGSKRLKAIVVSRGKHETPFYDKQGLADMAREFHDRVKDTVYRGIYENGTINSFESSKSLGVLPVKNYTTSVWDISKEDLGRFNAAFIRSQCELEAQPCWACRFHHLDIMTVKSGPYKGHVLACPDYEPMATCSSAIAQTDAMTSVIMAEEIDRLGMDANELAWVLGWVMECYEKGFLKKDDLDGLEMTWGNVEATRMLLRKIARREGCGDMLADGVMRASQRRGGVAADCAIYTKKGNSPRSHDHRSQHFELFDGCISSTGTIENHWSVDWQQFGIEGTPFAKRGTPDFSKEEIATVVSKMKGSIQFEDSMVTCRFNTATDIGRLARALNLATGWNVDVDEAMVIGRRAVHLLRAFNIRHGIVGRELDAPSKRYISAPVDGPCAGKAMGPAWDEMLNLFYAKMGWDEKTGKPLPGTLRELGLDDVVSSIWP